MKKLFKAAAAAVLAATAVTAAQAAVMADAVELPHAVVSEVTGDELTVTMNPDYESYSQLGGTYTMDKAARFDAAAVTQAQLDAYKNWICDFKIKFDMPEGYDFKGDEVILIGNYYPYGNIGFKVSRLAEMAGVEKVPTDRDYDLMQIISYAAAKVSVNLTFDEVVNQVKVFTCGLVDNGLPLNSKVTVQLVMYEDRNRTPESMHKIGDPIIYTKTANVAITDKDAYIDNDGTGNLRFISTYNGTAKADEFGTWIVSENILDSKTAFDEGTKAIKFSNTDDANKLIDNSTFHADVMQIPSDKVGTAFYAKSFVRVGAVTVWSGVDSTTVNDSKNYTSKSQGQ